MIRIAADSIDLNELLVPRDGYRSGAVVLFLGMVRNETRGRGVLRLEYEAYGAMAREEMERIAADVLRRHEIVSLDIVHRVGPLALGDVSVAIVARAPHRAAAFDACRQAIDDLKKRVPIWKKEFFQDGETWVGQGP